MAVVEEPRKRPFLIGVAGGTGSGKTTVADRLGLMPGSTHVALVKLDMYYRDRSHLPFEERASINYDHPEAFDWPLVMRHVDALSAGTPVDMPGYDFSQHVRTPETVPIAAG